MSVLDELSSVLHTLIAVSAEVTYLDKQQRAGSPAELLWLSPDEQVKQEQQLNG